MTRDKCSICTHGMPNPQASGLSQPCSVSWVRKPRPGSLSPNWENDTNCNMLGAAGALPHPAPAPAQAWRRRVLVPLGSEMTPSKPAPGLISSIQTQKYTDHLTSHQGANRSDKAPLGSRAAPRCNKQHRLELEPEELTPSWKPQRQQSPWQYQHQGW